MTSRSTLDRLRTMPPVPATVEAANTRINDLYDEIKETRKVRDTVVRRLAAEHGPAKTARLVNMPLPTVKAINRGR